MRRVGSVSERENTVHGDAHDETNISHLLAKLVPSGVIAHENALLGTELDVAPTDTNIIRTLGSTDSYERDLRRAKQEGLVSHVVLVPATEEYRLDPVDNTLLFRKRVD